MKNLDTKSFLNSYFKVVIAAFIVLTLPRIFNSVNYLIDTYEHIHASWLISIGKVPYRDFFEHHHPLLWYLFAPVTHFFYRDSDVIFAARFVAVGGYFATLYLLYILAKSYSNSKTGGLLSVLSMLCFSLFWRDIQNLRPDIFMYISILVAIKCFFDYLDTYESRFLCFSYLLWFVAFLFLQKAIIFALGFGIANFWLLYKKKILLGDVLKALIFPFILILILLYLLCISNTLHDWYQYNFFFNMKMKENFGEYSSGMSRTISYITILLVLIGVRIFKLNDKGIVLFSVWIVSNLFMLDFVPHPQYYFLTFVLSAILFSPFLKKYYFKYQLLTITLYSFFLINAFNTLYSSSFSSARMKKEVALIDYVLEQTTPDEKLLNGHYSYNLFNPDTDYYWFGFHNVTIIADLFLPRHFSYNEQIYKKPKFIFLDSMFFDKMVYHNSKWLRDRNTALLQKATHGDKTALNKLSHINLDYWLIDTDYINKNYRYIGKYGVTELWQRIDN